jgi:hypothetical protein
MVRRVSGMKEKTKWNPEADRRWSALRAMENFRKENDLPEQEYTEKLVGNEVQFLGVAPDGRQFGIKYVKP